MFVQREIDLLNFIYKEASTSQELTLCLLKSIMNKKGKIIEAVNDINKEFEEFANRSASLLSGLNTNLKQANMMEKMMASMGIKKEAGKDNSDANIAEMLIKALSIIEIEAEKWMEVFKEDDQTDANVLAEEFYEFISNAIVKLQEYL